VSQRRRQRQSRYYSSFGPPGVVLLREAGLVDQINRRFPHKGLIFLAVDVDCPIGQVRSISTTSATSASVLTDDTNLAADVTDATVFCFFFFFFFFFFFLFFFLFFWFFFFFFVGLFFFFFLIPDLLVSEPM